jgi:hypothetical protein
MISFAALAFLAAVLMLVVFRQDRAAPKRALRQGFRLVPRIAVTMPIAVVFAGFAGELLPRETVAAGLGPESRWFGILLAGLIGGFMPGGPIVSFSTALVIYNAGAGVPQIVAFITGWSVYAFHRTLSYEIPLMGIRFALVRLLASALLPLVAGGLSAAALALGFRLG